MRREPEPPPALTPLQRIRACSAEERALRPRFDAAAGDDAELDRLWERVFEIRRRWGLADAS